MSVGTDTQDLYVCRVRRYVCGIRVGCGGEVGVQPVGNVRVFLFDVDMIEKVAVHERAIAFGMSDGQTDVFVQVDAGHVFIADLARLVVGDHQLV